MMGIDRSCAPVGALATLRMAHAHSLCLQRNKLRLTATNDEVEMPALAVAQGAMTTQQITAWFVQHTTAS